MTFNQAVMFIIATVCFALVLYIVLTGQVKASESECYSIRDPDKRQECIAYARRQPADCTSIRDPDQRIICRQRAVR